MGGGEHDAGGDDQQHDAGGERQVGAEHDRDDGRDHALGRGDRADHPDRAAAERDVLDQQPEDVRAAGEGNRPSVRGVSCETGANSAIGSAISTRPRPITQASVEAAPIARLAADAQRAETVQQRAAPRPPRSAIIAATPAGPYGAGGAGGAGGAHAGVAAVDRCGEHDDRPVHPLQRGRTLMSCVITLGGSWLPSTRVICCSNGPT